MIRLSVIMFSVLCLGLYSKLLAAEPDTGGDQTKAAWLLPVPELEADTETPSLADVLPHSWGDDISSHAQIERYLNALAKAEPDRTRLEQYGASYEGRPLYYLVITSAENMQRLDEIRAANLRLADPRITAQPAADEIIAEAPALVWLAYCIHGNEISPSDAALLTAYHLLADRREETAELLDKLVVFIDPLQNPDGRDRFVNVYRETRGRFPQSNPFASEHVERWPGGRFNHYLFDMNRDWFLHSQTESHGRATSFLKWYPQVYVDAHEMGRNNTYFFPPPREPINHLILAHQKEWFERVGRRQAKWFDQYGFRYTTREIFDEFFPGYGSSWPLYHGSLGILWEQASSRGLVVDRDDETQLHYRDGVRHHYVSGLATLEVAAEHRETLLRDFYNSRQRALQLGQEGPTRDYFLLEHPRPGRAARLAKLLVDNGIEVQRLAQSLTAACTDARSGEVRECTIPPGSYHVPVAQPAGRMVRVLLDRHTDMGEEFIKRQLRRQQNRQRHEIYDITAWSVPLIFGVDCLASGEPLKIESVAWSPDDRLGAADIPQASVAYLIPGDDDGAMLALSSWLREGLRVHVADRPLTLGGKDFPRGTLIVHVHENLDKVHDVVRAAAGKWQLTVVPSDTAFVDRGANLGGPFVRWVKPPKAALLVDRPARYSVGHTWHLFDQYLEYPLTRVPGRFLASFDLDEYDVLVLPDGSYSGPNAPSERTVGRIKQWVQQGGTLIVVEGAAAWATGENVGLLASSVIRKPVESNGSSDSSDEENSTKPETEPPATVPGTFLRASVYDDHWVTFGYRPDIDVLMSSNTILKPLEPNKGRNLVTFAPEDELLVSGFCWPDTMHLMAETPYAMHQPLGAGHVIAFSDDPNYRAMSPELQRMFINAVFFGPGH